MGKRDKLRNVGATVKGKTKGTFGRIIKHMRSDEDSTAAETSSRNPRSPLPSRWGPPASVSVPLEFFSPEIAHINSTTTEDSDSLNQSIHPSRPLKNQNDSAIEKWMSVPTSKFHDQFAELRSLIHRRLKDSTMRHKQRAHNSYDDDTDDDIDPELREYLRVSIKSPKSAESLRKVETHSRPWISTEKENRCLPPIVQRHPTIANRRIPPAAGSSPGQSSKISERSEDGGSAKAVRGDNTPAESLKNAKRSDQDADNPSKRLNNSPNTQVKEPDGQVLQPDGYPDCIIVGIDPEGDVHPEYDDRMAMLQADLREGFMSFLTLPLSGPGSPVRAYGTDFYEYPQVPLTPPPQYDIDRQSLNTTCALYDSSYSVRSAKSAATGPGPGSQTGAGTHESLSSLGKSERKKLERELELARIAEEMHHRGRSPPQWTTFHKVDSVPACAQPIVTSPGSKRITQTS